MLNARIRKAWRAKGMPIAVIGDHADLTYAYELSRRRHLGRSPRSPPARASAKSSRPPRSRWSSSAKAPSRMAPPGTSRSAATSSRWPPSCATMGDIAEGWNGYALLHNAASPRRRHRHRLRAARWRRLLGRPGQARRQGRARRAVPARRRRIRHDGDGQGVRRLCRHARRCRRAPRRRHPAGRDLHREVRHLRQHRGPGADRRARRVPAGRGQGRLGDLPRPQRRARHAAAVQLAARSCAPRCMPSSRISRRSTRSCRPASTASRELAGRAIKTESAKLDFADRRFLPDQPHRARRRPSWPNARRCRPVSSRRRSRSNGIRRSQPSTTCSASRSSAGAREVGFVYKGAAVPRRAADLHRLHPARRPQDLGGRAGAPRPQRRRPVRPAAVASPTC